MSSKAVAEILGARLICEWEASFDCDAQWHDLFVDVGWFHSDKHSNNDVERISVGKVWFDQFYLRYLKDVCSWEDFRKLALNYLAQLQPVDDVERLVRDSIPLEPYVAVHIRMTDNVRWFKRTKQSFAERFASLDDYLKIISGEIESGMRVFVATDNAQIQRQIENRFMDQVFFLHKPWRKQLCFVPRRDLKITKMFQMKRTSPISTALVDLLILSKAQRLYGTCYSTYGKLAAVIGGIVDFHIVTPRGLSRSKDVDMMILEGNPFDSDDES